MHASSSARCPGWGDCDSGAPAGRPSSEEVFKALEDLQGLVEPIQEGTIDAMPTAARAAIEQLRDVVEVALQAPVRFAGEPPRPVKISDVRVVSERVAGRVPGLRADLAKTSGGPRSTAYISNGRRRGRWRCHRRDLS